MSDGYEILSLDDIEPVPQHTRNGQLLLAIERRIGFRAAGVNGWTGGPGAGLVPKHAEDEEEELYVVVRGHAAFTVDGAAIDAPAGTLVHVLAGEEREAVSQTEGTIVVAIGGVPGKAREASGWTDFVVADHYRREGRIDEARAYIANMVEAEPKAWWAPYNAACFEALAGDSERAFAHLDTARGLDAENVKKWAADDSDLESLHDDPRWQEVVA